MIFYGLNTSFRHYINGTAVNAMKLKHRNRPQVKSSGKTFHLYSLSNKLLPFQFYLSYAYNAVSADSFTISAWRIVKSSVMDPFAVGLSTDDYIDVLAELVSAGQPLNNYIKITSMVDKGIYFIGCTSNAVFPFDIPQGDWCSVIKLADEQVIVSEDFTIMCDAETFLADENVVKLEWSNSKDAFDILYQFNNVFDKFVNRVYFYADFVENNPTLVEEGINNDRGQFVQQSASYIDNYSLQEYIPEYLFRALILAKAHDSVQVTVRGNLVFGIMKLRECSIEWAIMGIEGVVNLKFENRMLDKHKSGCGENYVVGSPIPVVANNDTISVYPHPGTIPGLNVLDNDSGIGISTFQIVNMATIGNVIVARLNVDGTVTITSATPNFNYVSPPTITQTYTIRDFVNNTAQAVLKIIAVDWKPVEDIVWKRLTLLNGSGVLNLAGFSLLDNDDYPVNVDNVSAVPGLYTSIVQAGNSVSVNALGEVVYYYSSITPADKFIITYKNNILNTYKQQFLHINFY